MAIGQILRFSGTTIDKYDAVQNELGWKDDGTGATDGLITHACGCHRRRILCRRSVAVCCQLGTFFSQRLMPAFQKVGGHSATRCDVVRRARSYIAK